MPSAALSPSVVGAIDDLELVARLIVEGLRSGRHRSPFHGFSAEFSQYRAYRPGDDLKYLDWKLLARTNKLYTRQFRETTSLSTVLVIDTSASMNYPTFAGEPYAPISKFRYASILAAALAYLIVTQGDSVGLMTEFGGKLVYLPAKGGRSHLQAVLAQIARLEPAGSWQAGRVIARAAELVPRRGVMFVLSDFYDAEDDTLRELKRAARRGHDVTLMHVVSKQEIELPYRDVVQFEDLESGDRRMVNVGAVRSTYRAAVADFLARWRTRARADGLDYQLIPTDIAPEQALRSYLVRRKSGHPTEPVTWRDT